MKRSGRITSVAVTAVLLVALLVGASIGSSRTGAASAMRLAGGATAVTVTVTNNTDLPVKLWLRNETIRAATWGYVGPHLTTHLVTNSKNLSKPLDLLLVAWVTDATNLHYLSPAVNCWFTLPAGITAATVPIGVGNPDPLAFGTVTFG